MLPSEFWEADPDDQALMIAFIETKNAMNTWERQVAEDEAARRNPPKGKRR